MANTCIALNIFNQLVGSYRGEIRLKHCTMHKVYDLHKELEARGETVPNYLMKADGLDVILTLDVCKTCNGTGKTNGQSNRLWFDSVSILHFMLWYGGGCVVGVGLSGNVVAATMVKEKYDLPRL